jgi:anaerobic selenocysteine-containing dehydrogenase
MLLKNGLYDRDFLLTHTNASYLIQVDEGDENEGMPYLIPERDMVDTQHTVWDQKTGSIKEAYTKGIDPALVGEFRSPEGRTLKTGMQLLIERVMNEYTPEKAGHICGIPAETIERIALEMQGILFQYMQCEGLLPIQTAFRQAGLCLYL